MIEREPAFLKDRPPIRGASCSRPFGWAVKHADRPSYQTDCFSYDDLWNTWDRIIPPAFSEAILRAGFNTIRLVLTAGPFIEAGMTFDGARVDALFDPDRPLGVFKAIDRLVQAKLRVILDFHPDDGGGLPYSNGDIPDGPQHPTYESYKWILAHAAKRVAGRYSARDVAIELWNEAPAEVAPERWSFLIGPLFAVARAAAPEHTLIVGGSFYASIDGDWENDKPGGLTALSSAVFDANTIYTFHCYDRDAVTNQGVGWEKDGGHGPLSYLRWIECPPRRSRKASNRDAALARLAADRAARRIEFAEYVDLRQSINALINRYYDATAGPGNLHHPATWSASWLRDSRYALAHAWAMSQDVAPSRILVGEFGIWGDHIRRGVTFIGADEKSRANYLRAARQAAEYFGFGWSVWELCTPETGWKITGPESHSQILRPTLLKALFSVV